MPREADPTRDDVETYKDIKTPLGLLVAARRLISPRRRWTKGTWARNAEGAPVEFKDPEAVCWCARGALQLIALHSNMPGDTYGQAVFALNYTARRSLNRHFVSMIMLNDSSSSLHQDVLEAFDATIKRLAAAE